jgi:hypothetical protein
MGALYFESVGLAAFRQPSFGQRPRIRLRAEEPAARLRPWTTIAPRTRLFFMELRSLLLCKGEKE